jgi:hypothetical protein
VRELTVARAEIRRGVRRSAPNYATSKDTHETAGHNQTPTDITEVLQDKIRRLQTELRRTRTARSAIKIGNSQQAKNSRFGRSIQTILWEYKRTGPYGLDNVV